MGTVEKRVECIERLVLYSAIAFLAFRALLWLGTHVPGPAERALTVLWGVGALLAAVVLGMAFGLASRFSMQVMSSASTHMNAWIGSTAALRWTAGLVSIVLLVSLGIVYFEDSLSFWKNMIQLAGVLVGLLWGNIWLNKRFLKTKSGNHPTRRAR